MKFLFVLLISCGTLGGSLAQGQTKFPLGGPHLNIEDLMSENGMEKYHNFLVIGSKKKQARIDSLKHLVSISVAERKVEVLTELASEFSYGRMKEQYLKQAIELSNEIGYTAGAANCYYLLAMQSVYAINITNKIKKQQAIKESLMAFELWEELSDGRKMAPAALLSRLYKRTDKEKSDHYKNIAIEASQTNNDSIALSRFEYHRAHWEPIEERINALNRATSFATNHSDSLRILNKIRIAKPDSVECALKMLRDGLFWNDSAAIFNSIIPIVAEKDLEADTARRYIPFTKRNLAIASMLDTTYYALDKHYLISALVDLYMEINEDVKAMEILPESLEITRRKKLRMGELFIRQKYLNIYEEMGDYNNALDHAFLSYEIIDSTNNEHLAPCMNDLGRLYMKMERYDESLSFLQRALNAAEKASYTGLSVVIKDYLGWIYFKLGNTKKGLNMLDEALKIGREINIKPEYIKRIHLTQGKIYSEIGQHRKAITTLKRTIDLGDENSLRYLAVSYEALGDYKNSLDYFKKYKALADSINHLSKAKQIGFLESKVELDEQDKANKLLQKDKGILLQEKHSEERKSFFLLGLSLTLLVIVLMVYFIFRQRVRHERKLLKKEKEVDRLKSRFFSNISHELRTPLTLIAGPIRDFMNENQESSREPQSLGLALDNCQKLENFVDEILDLSKLDATKMEYKPAPCQLVPFLQRLVDEFDSHAESMDIHLHLSCTVDDEKWFLIDKAKLERIVNNLLSNAIKFTSSNGEVQMVVADDLTHGQLQISVKDNGQGIHTKDLPHIFNRYYQARHGKNSTEGGTGIGLNLSFELAKLLGGELTVQSKLNEGSIFTLHMPIIETQPDEKPLQQEYVEKSSDQLALNHQEEVELEILDPIGNERILIVEDHLSMRKYIRGILNPHFKVLTVSNGKKALELLQQESVDLILSDAMMPEMDGFELLSHLKSSEKTASIPVVLLTARADVEDRILALTTGVDDYMTKPFDARELLARIKNLLHFARHRATVDDVAISPDETLKEADTNNPMPQSYNLWIKKVENRVLDKLDESSYTIAHLAHDIGISERQFHRKIKQLTGLTPNLYIREIKLREARRMLEVGESESVAETCYRVGFDDTQYFSSIFQKRYGKNPSSYLRKTFTTDEFHQE